MRQGVCIGEWELVRQLNSGGMGQVWQARKVFATGDARVAAIKLLRPSGVLDPRSRDALLTEASIQMQLQHPNIPKVLDVGVHEGLPYLVMDYVAGQDLAQLMSRLRDRGTHLDSTVAAHVAREVAYALDYAHEFRIDGQPQDIIHRDVAPKNIMLSGEGGVFVLDFGVAEARSHQTSRNYVKGTLLYMAPEHALGFPTAQSDAWGLGTALWEMLENRVFRSEVPPDDLRAVANEGWVPPLTRAGIPDVLRFLTEGLLRKEARDRLTISDVIEHLESPEFPAQRRVLAGFMQMCFGAAVLRSGQTLHDFEISDELNEAIAAGVVAQQSPGLSKEVRTWAEEAFAEAGAPSPVTASRTKPIVPAALHDVDDDEAQLQVAGARGPRVVTERLAQRDGDAEASLVETTEKIEPILVARPSRTTAPAKAAESRVPPSSVAEPRMLGPIGGSARSLRNEITATPPPASGSGTSPTLDRGVPVSRRRAGLGVALTVVVVGLLGFGAWFASTTLMASPSTNAEAPSVAAATQPATDSAAVSSVPYDGAPAIGAESLDSEVPAKEPATPADGTLSPAPTSDAPEVNAPTPPATTRDVPTTPDEPAADEDPPPAVPAPAPTKRSKIYVAIGFVEAMDISIGGSRRSLGMKGRDRTTMSVRPGNRIVRWGPPGQQLKSSKAIRIREGTDYDVMLGAEGPVFAPREENGR
ncbi:MAG: protein kinase [Deltaproteobacteria bacterium]|nr:protein kinase [Deltaproteobacteria bacterium]